MDGIIVVDKAGGMTSHDVVARVRRIARTRRVGHGGTLDPMATGVLIIGIGRATRLLTYVIGAGKVYAATIRLGQATVTDDAEGEVTATTAVDGVTDAAIHAGLAIQTGTIAQVPSAVSAIKINGVRAYRRVREGESVDLPAREVTVYRLDVRDIRRADDVIDVEIDVECSSGTYIRAIARDLGAVLGVGGHLTALRRTAVGSFTSDDAVTLEDLAARVEAGEPPVSLGLDEAAAHFFPRRDATAAEAATLSHGGFLTPWHMTASPESLLSAEPGGVLASAPDVAAHSGERSAPYAVFAPDGHVIAIVRNDGDRAKPEIVLAPA